MGLFSHFFVWQVTKACRKNLRRPVGPPCSHSSSTQTDLTGDQNERFLLSLGDRRRGRLARLRRHRRHVFAAGVPAADRKGYRLVRDRHLQRDDNRLSGDGLHQHGLGHADGPVWTAAGGADWIVRANREPVRGEPRHLAMGVQFVFGLLVGASCAAIFAPMMATVTGWFDTHRSLAVSLVSAGNGMAPMTMAPLAAWLVSGHDWRTSMQIVALVVGAIMIPVSFLVRRPPALAHAVAAPVGETATQGEMSMGEALRSPQFLILLATNFFCCATHSGPIIHTVSYAVSCGIPLVAAVTIYSIEGFAGLGGRIAFGLLGDRFGAKRVLVSGLLLQAFGALAYVFAHQLATFYAVGAVFGFIYAGTMPLYAVLIRENFPLKMMGTVIGGTAMAGSLGMATGPLAGGLIYDAFSSYAWLYIASWAMGLGAFLMAMNFKPFPKPRAELAPAGA